MQDTDFRVSVFVSPNVYWAKRWSFTKCITIDLDMPGMISRIANCTMAMYRAVLAAFLYYSARSIGNSPIASRVSFSCASEAGMLDPRDSAMRPWSVMKSATCCGFEHHVKPLGIQAVVRPRWIHSAACPPKTGGPIRGRTFTSNASPSTPSCAAADPSVTKFLRGTSRSRGGKSCGRLEQAHERLLQACRRLCFTDTCSLLWRRT